VTGHGDRLEIAAEAASPLALDTIKAIFTYFIVMILVVGGGWMLYSMRLDPPESGSGTLSLAIVGFIGGALTFLFGQEVQTRTARQAAASTAASTAANVASTAAANSGVGSVSGSAPVP
jgi:hypothetical protein